MTITGGCLCGAVRYAAEGDILQAGHCHCTRCRRLSSTGHSSFLAMAEPGVRLSGDLRFFESPADSGNTVSRGFCPLCGSQVLTRNSGVPGMAFLVASSLDDPDVFQPQVVVYRASAPSWDAVDPVLTTFPGMPPQAGGPPAEA